MLKSVAMFGVFTTKQLKSLARAGYTGLSTDSPTEAALHTLAKDAKFAVIIRKAAWDTLDHALSDLATTIGRDGNPREYNRNGGYTRDFLICEEAHAILVGSGVGGRRLEIIQSVGKQIHHVGPQIEDVVVDLEAINRELQELFV